MKKIAFFIPISLSIIYLAFILWANCVTKFNAEEFRFKELSTLSVIRDTLKEGPIWNKVSQYAFTNSDQAKQVAGRKQQYFQWKTAVGICGVITAFTLLILLVVSLIVICKNMSKAPIKGKYIIITSIVLSIGIGIYLWCSNPLTSTGPVANLVALIEKYGDGTTIVVIGKGVAFLAALGIVNLVIACCCLLNVNAGQLKEKIYQAKILLGISSLALTLGVLNNYYFHNWSSAIVEQPELITFLANTLTIGVGILFTFLLLILFIPVLLFHQSWLSGNENQKTGTINWKSVITEFLTCIIPILVAVVAQWLGYSGK